MIADNDTRVAAVSGKREECLRFSLFLPMPSHFTILNTWLSHHFPSCHFWHIGLFQKSFILHQQNFNKKFFTSRTTGEALVQWYVVLVSFTLKSWQSWSLKRQAKKRRQVRVFFLEGLGTCDCMFQWKPNLARFFCSLGFELVNDATCCLCTCRRILASYYMY